jgi:hypothetical protein
MHEMSIAMSLVEAAGEEAERHGEARVTALHLRLFILQEIRSENKPPVRGVRNPGPVLGWRRSISRGRAGCRGRAALLH